ncbi:24447_t:CDS:2, partial [Entrophospora sp. SA101]
SGGWTSNCNQEVQNFVQTFERVKKLVPIEDKVRLERLQSFGQGRDLEQRVIMAFEDMASLLELNALNVDTESWIEDAENNLEILKGNVAHAFAKANSEAEKLLWERLANDLKKIDLTQLPYNHPLCSGIFDIESSPISDLPDSLRNVFEENTKKKFCIDNNEALLQTCEEYIQEVSISLEEPPLETCDPPFGQWIERPEKLKIITKQLLEALHQVWTSSKYKSYILNQTVINEGSYVCEVLAPLFNIALRDLPTKNETWKIWGDMASWSDTVQTGNSRSACRPDLMLIAFVNGQRVDILNLETGRPDSSKRKQEQDRLKLVRLAKNSMDFARDYLKQFIKKGVLTNLLSIFSINIAGDDLRIYSMRMEHGILRNCLLTRATIPLHMVSADAVYPLIHSLLTLRTAIIGILLKLRVYLEGNEVENSDNPDEKIA